MIKYQEVFNIKNKIYWAIYLAQILYQIYCSMKLKTLFLYNKSFCSIHIYNKFLNIKVNNYLISKSLYYKICVISKILVIIKIIIINQIPGHSNTIKDSCINQIRNSLYININLYTDINLYNNFNIYIKTNLGLYINSNNLYQAKIYIQVKMH